MCPSPKPVAQLVVGLGAIVVSGAFVEGHTTLPQNHSLRLQAAKTEGTSLGCT